LRNVSCALCGLATSPAVLRVGHLHRADATVCDDRQRMTAAVFAFVGVVVGAVLSGGFGLLTNRWRVAAEARASARLAASELARQIDQLDRLASPLAGEEPTGPRTELDPGWHDRLHVLAIALSYDDWLAVVDADNALRTLASTSDRAVTDDRDRIARLRDALAAGLSVLDEVARRGPPSFHRPTRASRITSSAA
jgi:hypothetical protein